MSTSPTLQPESGDASKKRELPVQDEQTGETIPHTPPSSPADNSAQNQPADNETLGTRELTLGTEELDETALMRKLAGERYSPEMERSEDTWTGNSSKEKQQEAEPHDLDKDIDAVLEVNNNGQVDLNNSRNFQNQNISVDSSENSILYETEKIPYKTDSSQADHSERATQEPGSEKSFTSDTDSSALAESVVKSVLYKAVDIVKSEKAVETLNEGAGLGGQDGVDFPKYDMQVGLFQYQEIEKEGKKEDEKDFDSDEEKEEKQEDVMVGLFQYTDADESDEDKSPEVSEIPDVVEEHIESLNDEEKSNILKLYGLEGVEPVSPKSASPSQSGPSSLEDNGQPKVLDVQREVYEPSTRHFSVTRDTSSSESTPRVEENGVFTGKVNSNHTSSGNSDSELEHELPENVKERQNVQNIGENEIEDVEKKLSSEDSGKAESNLPSSISPPLVQYEPVKENGKFRIIKTTKEGGGTSYSAIRVGGEVTSPRSVESQKSLPRDNVVSGTESEHTVQKSHGESLAASQSSIKSENLKENDTKITGVKAGSQDGIGISASAERKGEYTRESVELDRDKIRKLLEEENVPLKLSLSKDSSLSRDSGLPRSQYSDQAASKQLSLSQLQAPEPGQVPVSITSAESDRIRYTTRDIAGREVKRVGPQPYDLKQDRDTLASDSRYLQIPEAERVSLDRDRGLSEDYSRSDRTRNSSHLSSTYEEELLRSAYERVSFQGQEKHHTLPAVKSHETRAIPGFKTLQDQQAKWSDMFHKLEDEHRRELRSQYERHQYNIQRLQQQMELELQKQHLVIRKKLDIHKEALAKMSPDRDSSTRYRSGDRSLSPDRGPRSPERSEVERKRRDQLGYQNDLEKLNGGFDTKTWREIYREVREEEEQIHSPSKPLKRSLNDDFATLDSSIERSRPSGQRSSPPGISDISRSGSGERSREATTDSTQRTQINARFSKAERDRSLSKESGRAYDREFSPEGRDSRSSERESLSRSLGRKSVSPEPLRDVSATEGVSQHVRQLLDNLNDSRHSLHDLEDNVTFERPLSHRDGTGSERPRAGVYSSPMPFLSKGRHTKSTDISFETSALADSSRLTQSLPIGRDKAEFYSDRPRFTDGRNRSSNSLHMDDSCLSPSTRMNLREKHAKHLADLRAYYEDELKELRKALSDSIDASAVSVDTSMQSSAQTELLEAENKQLTDRCRILEDEIEEMQTRIRTLEQKNHGLEKRASEYAAAFTDSQTMSIQHRAHIEELQRYCRERDDLINELESKKVSNEDSMKIYKKNLEEEMELHRQDKIVLQRMMDRYESLEREYKLLQETMNTTENKLYEARTEVVELNRTISKLELENKRLGRENDNLRHKVTQSLNLSQLHESFGSPSSPREVQNSLKSHSPHAQHDASLSVSQPTLTDQRLPGFATSMQDWSLAQRSRPKSAEVNTSKREELNISRQSVVQKEKKESKSKRKENRESNKGRQSENSAGARMNREDSSLSASREDVSNRSQSRKKDVEERPVRDITPGGERTPPRRDKTPPRRDKTPPRRERTPPRKEVTSPRSASPCSQAESEVSDYSPLLKAERELFKLRDMMRQAVAVKPCVSPPQPKLQKKFYGSERPSSTDEYTVDLGVSRGRREKPSISSHSSVAKTKSSQTPVKSVKTNGKRATSGKSERSSKPIDKGPVNEERKEHGPQKLERESHRQGERTPGREDFANSSTRFDIDFNEEDKTLSVTPRKSDNQSRKQKNLKNGDADDQSREVKQKKTATKETNTGAEAQVENTLDMMRSGQYTSRPEWENIYTSLAKPKSDSQERQRSLEDKVKDRLRNIAEMESRYDGLQVQKRQLESSLNKIPLHGRVDRNSRRQKEELENELDAVERELGSLRMTLKRYNVLKTAG